MIREIDWEKGSALIGLVITLPLVMMIFFAIIGAMQAALIKQDMQYASYMAARQAVVSESYEDGLKAAQAAADKYAPASFKDGNAKVQLTYVGTATANAYQYGSLDWTKGNFIYCIVSADYNMFVPFGRSSVGCGTTMMIENNPHT